MLAGTTRMRTSLLDRETKWECRQLAVGWKRELHYFPEDSSIKVFLPLLCVPRGSPTSRPVENYRAQSFWQGMWRRMKSRRSHIHSYPKVMLSTTPPELRQRKVWFGNFAGDYIRKQEKMELVWLFLPWQMTSLKNRAKSTEGRISTWHRKYLLTHMGQKVWQREKGVFGEHEARACVEEGEYKPAWNRNP